MTNRIGIAMQTMYAPWVNLVISTTTRTRAVSTAPIPLIARDRCMAAAVLPVAVRSSRFQCRTIPHWLRVKDTKTPRM